MNIDEVVKEIQRTACAECKFGKAIEALRELQEGYGQEPQSQAEKPAAMEEPGSVPYGQKQCNRCGKVKPWSEYYRHPARKDGRDGTCKICKAEYMKRYRAGRKKAATTAGGPIKKTKRHNNNLFPEGAAVLLFECAPCRAKFSTQLALDEHNARYHAGEPPTYGCDECDLVFRSEEALQNHRELRHA